jgi:PPK2 family polyphosphate:nucleotide phosphotransferase
MLDIRTDDFRVSPDEPVDLGEVDANAGRGLGKEAKAALRAQRNADREVISDLQQRLFAEKRQALLIVLLATDTGGKDSTIRRVFSGVNPHGCRVTSFGVPTDLERAHHFLWRIDAATPRTGMIAIFNRSHYEDVTVARVNGTLDTPGLSQRYQDILDFERMLTSAGTAIVKLHLVISKDEQADRLRDRLEDPSKHWKFDPSDLENRARWDDYQTAFQDAINATTTAHAPWYVVPANAKRYRDALVAQIIREILECMNPQFPLPVPDIDQYEVT